MWQVAAENCDLDGLRRTVKTVQQAKELDDMGKSALHWVASTPLGGRGQPMECAAYLVEKKANIEQQDSSTWRALHHAASVGRADMVEFLLGRGAVVEAKTRLQKTPRDLAVGEDVIKLLAAKEALKSGSAWTCSGCSKQNSALIVRCPQCQAIYSPPGDLATPPAAAPPASAHPPPATPDTTSPPPTPTPSSPTTPATAAVNTPSKDIANNTVPDDGPREGEYRSLLVSLRGAFRNICIAYHTPDITVPKLKALSAKATVFMKQLLEIEMQAVEKLIKGFNECKVANYDKNKGKPQPLKPEYQSVEGLLLVGKTAQIHFKKHMELVCENAGLALADLLIGPVKGETRVRAKMQELQLNGQNPLTIFDMNRATLLSVHKHSFVRVLLALGQFFDTVKMKNKFKVDKKKITEPPCLFFQLAMVCDEIAEYLEPNAKYVVELQITTPEILALKNDFCHALYEIDRLDDKLDPLPTHCVVCHRPQKE